MLMVQRCPGDVIQGHEALSDLVRLFPTGLIQDFTGAAVPSEVLQDLSEIAGLRILKPLLAVDTPKCRTVTCRDMQMKGLAGLPLAFNGAAVGKAFQKKDPVAADRVSTTATLCFLSPQIGASEDARPVQWKLCTCSQTHPAFLTLEANCPC